MKLTKEDLEVAAKRADEYPAGVSPGAWGYLPYDLTATPAYSDVLKSPQYG